MKSLSLPMLPAKNFVFPVLRPLMTMIKCVKAMARFEGSGAQPIVLRRECFSNAAYLAKALESLAAQAKTAGADRSIDRDCRTLVDALSDLPSRWKTPVDGEAFGSLIRDIEAFCLKHKTPLGRAYRQNKDQYGRLYRESVLKRKLLLLHGPNDCPEVLCQTLSAGSWYEVEARPVNEVNEKSAAHHVTLLLCSRTREAVEHVNQCAKRGIDLFLSDLGRKIPVLDMNLCRLVGQAKSKGVSFVTSPYVAMKLLPAIEEIYVESLARLDASIAELEGGIEMEEEALIRGIDEAVLYAELIVESAWKKLAGIPSETNSSAQDA